MGERGATFSCCGQMLPNGWRGEAHVCLGKPLASVARSSQATARPWSNAVPTTCGMGHNHPSRLEAKTCDLLCLEYLNDETVSIARQVRFPLLAVCGSFDRPLGMTIDFVVWRHLGNAVTISRLIDAKGRKSREWERGKAALEATLGVKVEEVKS